MIATPTQSSLLSMINSWLYPSYMTYSPPIQLGVSAFLQSIPDTPFWLHSSVFPNSATTSVVHFDLYISDPSQSPKYNQSRFLDQIGQNLEAVVRSLEAKHFSISTGGSGGEGPSPKTTY